jgi:hypothetical protein
MSILYNQRDATYVMFFIIIISALRVSFLEVQLVHEFLDQVYQIMAVEELFLVE